MIHGFGKLTISLNEYYEGNWEFNSPEGYGEYYSPHIQYKGNWKNEKVQGKGHLI